MNVNNSSERTREAIQFWLYILLLSCAPFLPPGPQNSAWFTLHFFCLTLWNVFHCRFDNLFDKIRINTLQSFSLLQVIIRECVTFLLLLVLRHGTHHVERWCIRYWFTKSNDIASNGNANTNQLIFMSFVHIIVSFVAWRKLHFYGKSGMSACTSTFSTSRRAGRLIIVNHLYIQAQYKDNMKRTKNKINCE